MGGEGQQVDHFPRGCSRLIGISRRWGWAWNLPGGWLDGGPWITGGKWMQRRAAPVHTPISDLTCDQVWRNMQINGTAMLLSVNLHPKESTCFHLNNISGVIIFLLSHVCPHINHSMTTTTMTAAGAETEHGRDPSLDD